MLPNLNTIKLIHNFIDGSFYPPQSNQYLNNYNPSTGEVYSQIANSNEQDVQQAINAAQKASIAWANTPIENRSNILLRIAELIEQNVDELALAECIDNGKPLQLAKTVDIPRAAANFRFFATAIIHASSESHFVEGINALNYTLRRPLGVVACISPWNLPLYLFTWKIAPALATGNCVVAKPSEITPLTAYLLAHLCIKAGLPNGVLNIIHGLGAKAGALMVTNSAVKAISFTGGTKTGAAIAQSAAPLFKKLSLELGGKNANIIFADCNFNQMLETTIRSSFSNQGQICLCGSRILIEKSIYSKFATAFINKTKKLQVGDPLLSTTNIGAIVSKEHFEKIQQHIKIAINDGGNILTGGNAITIEKRCENGWFIQPTVIEGLDAACTSNQEEIFGPVVTLIPFDGMEEAISLANSTRYGLAASIWTKNLKKAHYVAQQLQCGIVWVNCWMLRDLRTPFGGVKQSGIGREGGWEALRFFTDAKNVCIKYVE